MEHMLFKGTPTRGVGEVARHIESAGGEINAWTSRDNTVFHVIVPSRHAQVGIDVLADAIQNSLFDANELAREQEVVLEEIRQGQDDPMRMLGQALFHTVFTQHPYRNPVIGKPETVSRFRQRDLNAYRDRWYRPSNINLVVAGDFDPGAMRQTIETSFAQMPAGPAPKRRRAREAQGARQASSVVAADVTDASLALAFRAPRLDDPDCAALDLLTVALGQGESSLLSSDLVRDRELCRGAYSYLHALQDHSLVIVGATAGLSKLRKALPLIGARLEGLRSQSIAPDLLAKARHAIEADYVYQRETVEGAARNAGSDMALTGRADHGTTYLSRITSLTPEDLRQAAQRLFDPKRLNLVAVLPQSRSLAKEAQREKFAESLMGLALGGMDKGRRRSKSATKSSKVKPKAVVEHKLANGMKVIIKHDPSVPIVAVRAVWSGGLLLESNKNSGISALLASVITRGCGRRSAEEIIEDVDASAATLAGFSGRNSFGLRAEWLAKDWQRGFDLLSECLLSPRFDAEEVERAKRKQLARLEAQKDSASHQAFRLFQERLFRRHAYRRNGLGSADSVHSLSSRAVAAFYKRHYQASDMSLAIVGDINPEQVLKRIQARFESEPSSKRSGLPLFTENFKGRSEKSRQVFGYMEREQAQLVIGFPGVRIDDPDRFALEVLTTVLGGQSGRLFLDLRDKQSLAYQIGALSLEGLDPGFVAIYLSCAPEKIDTAVAAVTTHVAALRDVLVTGEELKRAKRYLVGTHEISLQRRASVAAAMAFHDAYGLSQDSYLRYAAEIQRVTRADLQRVARRVFDWQTAVTATIMPPSASPEAARRMRGSTKKRPKQRSRKKTK